MFNSIMQFIVDWYHPIPLMLLAVIAPSLAFAAVTGLIIKFLNRNGNPKHSKYYHQRRG